MKKRILCLAMTFFMAVGLAMPAHAQDFVGGNNWAVTFTGKEMSSNFTSAEMTEEVLNIQPGDSITVQVSSAGLFHRPCRLPGTSHSHRYS